MPRPSSHPKPNPAETITRAIIERLQAGTKPWVRPCHRERGPPRLLPSCRRTHKVNGFAVPLRGSREASPPVTMRGSRRR